MSFIEKKLANHPSCQCKVKIFDNGTIQFISYSTLVIEANPVEGNEYELYCSGTYSQTTRKQIGYFLKEYFWNVDYYDMKKIAETGELIRAKRK